MYESSLSWCPQAGPLFWRDQTPLGPSHLGQPPPLQPPIQAGPTPWAGPSLGQETHPPDLMLHGVTWQGSHSACVEPAFICQAALLKSAKTIPSTEVRCHREQNPTHSSASLYPPADQATPIAVPPRRWQAPLFRSKILFLFVITECRVCLWKLIPFNIGIQCACLSYTIFLYVFKLRIHRFENKTCVLFFFKPTELQEKNKKTKKTI